MPTSHSPLPTPGSIVFIGGGNMARSLIGALIGHGADAATIAVAEPRADARDELARAYGVRTFADNADAVAGAGCVVLAVKPQMMRKVCEHLAEPLRLSRPLLISIAAGVRIEQLERWLGAHLAIVRCMPNTPALLGAGASGLCANPRVGAAQRALAERILNAAGITRWIEREAQMDIVTALSGSGPAYFFLLVETMEDAAVELGLPRDTARALAVQTCLGAGRMLAEGSESAATLRARVTSPQGTTHAALEVFVQGDLRALVQRAMAAATRRGGELSAALD
ncbi:MAG TPA: pyrroline-5-carboxylate reductase [Rhodanobacteraceae bacterium]|nr:pyrroline-5-carboxylate reductase [Rhodanobacteraceae bacterium]